MFRLIALAGYYTSTRDYITRYQRTFYEYYDEDEKKDKKKLLKKKPTKQKVDF